MSSKLIAYSMDFASFLIQKIKNKDLITKIILFGSVAREEAGKDSDIDIFIDIVKDNKEIEKEILNILKDFLKSTKYKHYWSLLGIKNELKLIIDPLDNWPDLKQSIIANGISLYGKFKLELKEGKHEVFFIWENIKPNSKRVLFNKNLFGYKKENKFYGGLIQKYKAEKLGKGCIVVDLDYSNIFHKLFKKYNITVKIKKVLDYSK